jgi:hypothetical protein
VRPESLHDELFLNYQGQPLSNARWPPRRARSWTSLTRRAREHRAHWPLSDDGESNREDMLFEDYATMRAVSDRRGFSPPPKRGSIPYESTARGLTRD